MDVDVPRIRSDGWRRPLLITAVIAVLLGIAYPLRWLDGIEAPHAHRSTSPNTISSEPRMAETSASMWPRHRKSIA